MKKNNRKPMTELDRWFSIFWNAPIEKILILGPFMTLALIVGMPQPASAGAFSKDWMIAALNGSNKQPSAGAFNGNWMQEAIIRKEKQENRDGD